MLTAYWHVSMATKWEVTDLRVTLSSLTWISLADAKQQFTVDLREHEELQCSHYPSTERTHGHVAGVGLSHTLLYIIKSRAERPLSLAHSHTHSHYFILDSLYSRLHSVIQKASEAERGQR